MEGFNYPPNFKTIFMFSALAGLSSSACPSCCRPGRLFNASELLWRQRHSEQPPTSSFSAHQLGPAWQGDGRRGGAAFRKSPCGPSCPSSWLLHRAWVPMSQCLSRDRLLPRKGLLLMSCCSPSPSGASNLSLPSDLDASYFLLLSETCRNLTLPETSGSFWLKFASE